MASEKTVETEEAVTEKVETETEEIEEIQTEEAETETEETETGEIETEEIETEEVEIEETEIEETETEESKDRHKKSVNLNTTEQIKDLAGRIELAFAVFDTTNNTFTNQQFIKRPMEFTILYSGIMISMMRMSLSLLTRKLLKQMTLYWKMRAPANKIMQTAGRQRQFPLEMKG